MRVQVTRSCEDQELIEGKTIKFEDFSQGEFVGMSLEGNTSHWV